MKSIYIKKKATVARQREVLSEIYDLTQEAPLMVMQATMDKNLDATAQQLDEMLVDLTTTLEQTRHLWDDNHDR